jgi:NAD(P)-dependent dehydrogenase (short-subunit alcohol dehydrogenase family)
LLSEDGKRRTGESYNSETDPVSTHAVLTHAVSTPAVSNKGKINKGKLMTSKNGCIARLNIRQLLACICGVLLAMPVSLHAQEEGATDAQRAVLITGSNRGIGLEFVRQYAELGWQVIATCRTPEKAADLQELAAANPAIVIAQLDVTDAASIEKLKQQLGSQPLALLINNAALLGPRSDQSFSNQDYELAARQYAVNALGPLRVTAAFVDNVRAAGPGKVITLGSAAGSNGYLQPPADFYSYRASKAATHLLMHNLANELADEGIVVGLINPGMVDTRGLADIGPDDPVPEDFAQIVKLIRAGVIELTPPADAVAAMIELIDGLGPEQSGVFLNFDGQVMPW